MTSLTRGQDSRVRKVLAVRKANAEEETRFRKSCLIAPLGFSACALVSQSQSVSSLGSSRVFFFFFCLPRVAPERVPGVCLIATLASVVPGGYNYSARAGPSTTQPRGRIARQRARPEAKRFSSADGKPRPRRFTLIVLSAGLMVPLFDAASLTHTDKHVIFLTLASVFCMSCTVIRVLLRQAWSPSRLLSSSHICQRVLSPAPFQKKL